MDQDKLEQILEILNEAGWEDTIIIKDEEDNIRGIVMGENECVKEIAEFMGGTGIDRDVENDSTLH